MHYKWSNLYSKGITFITMIKTSNFDYITILMDLIFDNDGHIFTKPFS
jgi:hypothetical protein